MIYIKAYTRVNLGDDLLIKLLCEDNKNEKFCILADTCYKDIFKNVKNLTILDKEYKKIQSVKQDYNKFVELTNKFVEKISKECKTMIYIGGSIFIENGSTSIQRLKQLKKEIEYFENSYIIGANFGPYITDEYLNYVHDEIIPALTKISFRDMASYNLFNDLENVYYAPDVVFSLNTNITTKNKEVGISIINHLEREKLKINYENYLDTLIEISKKYIILGYKIRLLSFCEYEKDTIAIDDFIEKLPIQYKKNIIIDYYNGNIEKFLNIFSKLDTIIATRFHSIVLGFKYNCNVLPICYSNKSYNLLTDLNINKYIEFSNIKDLLNLKPIKMDNLKLNDLKNKANKHFEYKKTISD